MKKIKLLIILISLLIAGCQKNEVDLVVVTENNVPFSYSKNDTVAGMDSEIVKKILANSKIKNRIEILHWDKAYEIALSTPNTLIYSIAKTKERKKLFKWIGKISREESNIYALSSRSNLDLTSINDLKKYKFSLIKESYIATYLENNNISINDKNYSYSTEELINKLKLKEVDIILTGKTNTNYTIRQMGYNLSEFQEILELKELTREYYIALNCKSDQKLFLKLIDSYKKIKETGYIDKIKQKYLKTE